MNCQACGAEAEEGDLFCGECGVSFNSPTKSESPPPSAASAPPRLPEQQEFPEGAQQARPERSFQEQQVGTRAGWTKTQRGALLIGFLVLISFLCAMVVENPFGKPRLEKNNDFQTDQLETSVESNVVRDSPSKRSESQSSKKVDSEFEVRKKNTTDSRTSPANIKPARKPTSDVILQGRASWSSDDRNDTLTLKLGRVENVGDATSGELRVELWCSKSPIRQNSEVRGHVIGGMNLGRLKAGASIGPIDETVTFRQPPNGEYHTALVILENDKRVVQSVFEGLRNFVKKEILFEGGFSFQTYPSQGIIEIGIDKLSNRRSSGESGTLLLEVWFSRKHPDTPQGENRSYLISEIKLGQLKGNYSFNDYSQRLQYSAPPSGNYWVTLTVSEYVEGGYVLRDRVNTDKSYRF